MAWVTDDIIGQYYFIDYTKISFVIFFMVLFKTVLLIFCSKKPPKNKTKLKAKNQGKDFKFMNMNVLLAFKNLKIICEIIMFFSSEWYFLKEFLLLIKHRKIPHDVKFLGQFLLCGISTSFQNILKLWKMWW